MSLLQDPSTVRSVLRLDVLDVDAPGEVAQVGDARSQAVGDELPQVVGVDGGSIDAIEELLLAVANGDRDAFVALENHMGGLVRVNIRRVLRDASRSDAVTQEFFAEVRRDAMNFDPDRDSAQAWLLTRAHLRAMDGLRSGSV